MINITLCIFYNKKKNEKYQVASYDFDPYDICSKTNQKNKPVSTLEILFLIYSIK